MKTAAFLAGFFLAVLYSLMLANDPSPGQAVFERRCAGCHSLDREKEGPRLRGVYGRTAGKTASFVYSAGLKKSGITWDAATLDLWLTDPEKVVPDTDMGFRLSKPEERKQIIAYLKQISKK